jgi:hypothetical protein
LTIRVTAENAGDAAELVHISKTQQVGTHSRELGEVRNNPHADVTGKVQYDGNGGAIVTQGKTASYQCADPLPPGMCDIPGLGRTSIEAAVRAGLAEITSDGVFLTEEGERHVSQAQRGQRAVAKAQSKEQLENDRANFLLDSLEASMGREKFVALANAVREDDPLAFSVVPAEIVQAYTKSTLGMVRDMGFSSLELLRWLPEDQAWEARDAIISQSVTGVRLAAQRAIENLDLLTEDEDFVSDVEATGSSIVGSGRAALLVLPNGQTMPLLRALMTNVLTSA